MEGYFVHDEGEEFWIDLNDYIYDLCEDCKFYDYCSNKAEENDDEFWGTIYSSCPYKSSEEEFHQYQDETYLKFLENPDSLTPIEWDILFER